MKTLKRQRDLKTKLVAAISMLLVSSLMMVTSTYAWFTLSTAPEVTGITTAVGANGNLEMALLNPLLQDTDKALKSGWGDAIVSTTADSMDSASKLLSEANITWGNLVDLRDNNTYGLNNIVLYPSQLATEKDADENMLVKTNPLSRPVFGADGRIAELKADTLTASFISGTFSNENALGVRAIGTASSMTARELAHRTALSSAASASTAAKSVASATLKANGNVLAGMAITYVGDQNATFTYDQVNTLKTIIQALASAHESIELSMRWYLVAHNIAPGTVNDSTYLAIQNKIMDEKTSLATIIADDTIVKPENFSTTYDKLQTSQGKVSTALSQLTTLLTGKDQSSTFTWSNFSDALNAVMDYNKMKLNNLPMDEVKKQEDGVYVNASTIVTAMGREGLQLQMPTGSGVFADIADFCGTYTAGIIFPNGTTVMGVGIGGVEATMVTNDPVNPTYLADMRAKTNAFKAEADAGVSTKSITDFYGYIVDLGFRTNASGSNLLLQADAIDRIYGEDGQNSDTMGHGSTMTFTATDQFGVPKVQSLMSSLRIIFFDTETRAIIAQARLNPDTADIEGNAVTMKMAMWDSSSQPAKFKEGADANVITELKQNEAKAISVLVYLDGENVKNADVATSGSQSMVGTMNLQFASSAELVPMEYADLKEGKSDADTPETITLNKVTVDNATKELGVSVAQAQAMSITGLGNGFGVILNGVPANGVVKATIGGTTLDAHVVTFSGMRGYAFAYDGVTADTEIVITVTEAAGGETPEEPAAPTTYTVTVDGADMDPATAGQDYEIVVPDGQTVVSVMVGGVDVTEHIVDGNVIPGAYVNGDIAINTTPATSSTEG